MQSNEKKSIDTRSFPEIWTTLTSGEQALLQENIIHNTEVTPQTFWNWRNGKVVPVLPFRKEILASLKKLGINANIRTLFRADN